MKLHKRLSSTQKLHDWQIPAILGVLLLANSFSAHSQNNDLREIEDSIIKIYTTQAAPDYFTPWRLLTPRQSSGSGSVVTGNLILTNAHVVANAS